MVSWEQAIAFGEKFDELARRDELTDPTEITQLALEDYEAGKWLHFAKNDPATYPKCTTTTQVIAVTASNEPKQMFWHNQAFYRYVRGEPIDVTHMVTRYMFMPLPPIEKQGRGW